MILSLNTLKHAKNMACCRITCFCCRAAALWVQRLIVHLGGRLQPFHCTEDEFNAQVCSTIIDTFCTTCGPSALLSCIILSLKTLKHAKKMARYRVTCFCCRTVAVCVHLLVLHFSGILQPCHFPEDEFNAQICSTIIDMVSLPCGPSA